MRKIIKLTESDLTRIVKRVINESERVYGHEEIGNLYSSLGDDEDVSLDDSSGELSGQVVRKIDNVKNMLERALQIEDWDMVRRTVRYLDSKF